MERISVIHARQGYPQPLMEKFRFVLDGPL